MAPVETEELTSQELIDVGNEQGHDLGQFCYNSTFFKGDRWIYFWRKDDGIHYNLQGKVCRLPEQYENSAHLFTGWWNESGYVKEIHQAVKFLVAWLIDKKEVDDLPPRCTRSSGIG